MDGGDGRAETDLLLAKCVCVHMQAPKDWMLVLVVGALILIDITILLVYTAVEGYRGNLVAIQMPNRENMEDIEGVRMNIIYFCVSAVSA